jgi:hypothetical protein
LGYDNCEEIYPYSIERFNKELPGSLAMAEIWGGKRACKRNLPHKSTGNLQKRNT